ncbi:MAG: protein-tyrosine-phosphatase [Chitinophagales bacterium]
MVSAKTEFYPKLTEQIAVTQGRAIDDCRKQVLQPLIDFIRAKIKKKEAVRLNFICTHNSRRSQMAQIWAHTAALYYGVDAACFSGGVEITEFNKRAVEAISEAGFRVQSSGDENPKYKIYCANHIAPIMAFSKLYDDAANPNKNFAAIMTCSDADENCPYIIGAEVRIPIRYEDPKVYDNNPNEGEKYMDRSMQIASEMFYVFSKIND